MECSCFNERCSLRLLLAAFMGFCGFCMLRVALGSTDKRRLYLKGKRIRLRNLLKQQMLRSSTRDLNLLMPYYLRPRPTEVLVIRDLNLPALSPGSCGKVATCDLDLLIFAFTATQTYRFYMA
jgi:hypothetical protein